MNEILITHVILVLFIFAGMLNAIMDIIEKQFNQSKFVYFFKYRHWLNPLLSWKNKWKNGDRSQGERFLGSSTVFVMFTDFWHFVKFLLIIDVMVIVYLSSFIDTSFIKIICYYFSFIFSFELFFKYIFRLKQ